MDHQIKIMIVDAIISAVKKAPTMNNFSVYVGVSRESFETWVKYVKSILDITSRYLDTNSINNQINDIIAQDNSYALKTTMICDILLNIARTILS